MLRMSKPGDSNCAFYSAIGKGEQAEKYPPVQLNYFDNIIFCI